MSSALRITPLMAAVLALGPGSPGRAQTSTEPVPTAGAEPAQPPAPAESTRTTPSPKHERAMSGDLTATLAGMLPKYNPPAKPGQEPADLRELDKPKNGIIRLPKYEVRVAKEPKPMVFNESELLTGKGMAELAMKRHPGLRIGNLFGLNEGIAIMMYQEQVRLDNMAAMADLANNARNSGDFAGADSILFETNRAYYRPSDIGGDAPNVGH